MARSFGGRFSPGAPKTTPEAEAAREALAEARRVDAAGARANLMFAPPVVAALFGLFGGPAALVLSLGAAAVLALSAWLLREACAPRPLRRPPGRPVARPPLKSLAALLTVGGTGLAAPVGGHGRPGQPPLRISAGGLHLAAFGLDPFRSKRVAGGRRLPAGPRGRRRGEAEAHLAATRAAVAALRDRARSTPSGGFEALARA
jgi:hypothetical protein